MSEFSFSISKKAGFSSCISHFFHFCFFLLSHPLYLSYFIFFSPYILKLLSFLSPLFFTTFLLLFAFLTLMFQNRDQSQNPTMGFLATTYQFIFDSLRPRIEDQIEEIQPFEELEAYKVVFETYTFETGENQNQNPYDEDVPEVEVEVDFQETLEDFPEQIETFPGNPSPCEEGKEKEDKEVEKIKDLRSLPDNSGEENLSVSLKSESSPWSSPSPSPGSFSREYSLGSYGSMRKEKEWRRTLACKLFEERHNADGTEGMDSLWETYEKTESKKLQKNFSSKMKKGKKIEQDEDEEDEEREDEDRNGQLCCLQALKFSAGKMNLGLKRPNLVKMSKALKGFGWLSKHGRSSKKGL